RLVLLDGDESEARLERRVHGLAELLERLVDAHEMVVHVAEVGSDVVAHELQVGARLAREYLEERRHHPFEPAELAPDLVDPAREARVRVVPEQPVLEVLHGPLELVEHRKVVVDHEVENRVERVARSLAQEVRDGLGARPHLGVRRGRAVPHGDEVVRPDEHVGLAVLDLLVLLVPARRPDDDEERLPVLLDLRPLMCAERVLDCEVVQVEHLLHLAQELRRRLVDADPDEVPLGALEVLELVDVQLAVELSVGVEAALHHLAHAPSAVGMASPAATLAGSGARAEPSAQPCACARFSALTTASSDAVTMLGSRPAPHTRPPSSVAISTYAIATAEAPPDAACSWKSVTRTSTPTPAWRARANASIGPLPVPAIRRRSSATATSARTFQTPGARASSPTSCATIASGPAAARYSRSNAARTAALVTSSPVPSAISCTTRPNSIWSRRGRTKPWSSSITHATPPLPDWLFTRITAS